MGKKLGPALRAAAAGPEEKRCGTTILGRQTIPHRRESSSSGIWQIHRHVLVLACQIFARIRHWATRPPNVVKLLGPRPTAPNDRLRDQPRPVRLRATFRWAGTSSRCAADARILPPSRRMAAHSPTEL